MTSFQQFSSRCKIRYDYGDMIQVRYLLPDGDNIDTWVSGKEVLSRSRSAEMEKRIRDLKKLDLRALRQLTDELPERGKKMAWSTLMDQVAENVEKSIGGNLIGDSLADAVRDGGEDEQEKESQHWIALLQDQTFRSKVLELAWIQLEGSIPDDSSSEPDDWI